MRRKNSPKDRPQDTRCSHIHCRLTLSLQGNAATRVESLSISGGTVIHLHRNLQLQERKIEARVIDCKNTLSRLCDCVPITTVSFAGLETSTAQCAAVMTHSFVNRVPLH
jgi:hypothetical protein